MKGSGKRIDERAGVPALIRAAIDTKATSNQIKWTVVANTSSETLPLNRFSTWENFTKTLSRALEK